MGFGGFGEEDLLAVGLGGFGRGVDVTDVRRAAGLGVCATRRDDVPDVAEHAASINASRTPINEGVDRRARGSLLRTHDRQRHRHTAPEAKGLKHRRQDAEVDSAELEHPKGLVDAAIS
jgi:hypothetical protein